MSDNKEKQDPNKQSIKEKAINIKEKESNAKKISPQEEQRQEIRQPRDNA